MGQYPKFPSYAPEWLINHQIRAFSYVTTFSVFLIKTQKHATLLGSACFLFGSIPLHFQRPDVTALEGEHNVFTQNTAGNSVPVPLAEFILSQIGADNNRLTTIESSIDQIIEHRSGELIIDLGPQIINNQEIAIEITVQIRPGLPPALLPNRRYSKSEIIAMELT